jgi:hypothetical protein
MFYSADRSGLYQTGGKTRCLGCVLAAAGLV